MKKRFVVVICLICLAVALWWCGRNSATAANPTVASIGFETNQITTNLLLFRVSGISADVGWTVVGLEQKEQAKWMPVPTPTSWSSSPQGNGYVVRVPSTTTNGQWRISLSYQKRRTGLPGIYDRISETYARVVKNQHYDLYRGATVLVTNNVAVGGENSQKQIAP